MSQKEIEIDKVLLKSKRMQKRFKKNDVDDFNLDKTEFFTTWNPLKLFSKKMVGKATGDQIVKVEIKLKKNIIKWYRSTFLDSIIVLVILLAGLIHFEFSQTRNLMELMIFIAFIFSVMVFLKRRYFNIKFLVKNRKIVNHYSKICIGSFFYAPFGMKTEWIAYQAYLSLYEEKVKKTYRVFHKVASKLTGIVDRDEVFHTIYPRIIKMSRTFIFDHLVRFTFFAGALIGFKVLLKYYVFDKADYISYFYALLNLKK